MAADAGHAVYIGNLRGDVRVGALKQSIIHLLQQISVSVTKHHIDVHNKPHSVFAFVHVTSQQEQELVLDMLNTSTVLASLDLSGIVKDGRQLKVAPKLERWQLVSSRKGRDENGLTLARPQHNLTHPGVTSQWSDSSPNDSRSAPSEGRRQQATSDARRTYTVVGKKPPPTENHNYVKREKPATENHYYVKRENTVPMFEALLKNRAHYGLSDSEAGARGAFSNGEKGDDELDSDDDIIVPTSKKFKRKNNQRKKRQSAARLAASGQTLDLSELKRAAYQVEQEQSGPCRDAFFHRDVYVLDEVLGNESRLLEFKRGQGMYVHRQLADHVAVYISAFLNTEGGTLLVGVNDDGEVKGVDVDRHLEDRLRLAIDSTVKRISPSVFPNMYRVQFVPVTDAHNQPLADRRVVQIGVLPGTSGQLYQTPAGDVYVRRDGSVQGPLRANDIQEWTRMMLYEEQRKKDNEITNLREKEKQLLAQLQERRVTKEKLAPAVMDDDDGSTSHEKSKSKVCVII